MKNTFKAARYQVGAKTANTDQALGGDPHKDESMGVDKGG